MNTPKEDSPSMSTALTDNQSTTGAAQRLIVALDVPTLEEARQCVQALEGIVWFYKIGLELFQAVNHEFIQEMKARGCRVFLDLKMNDVDETIRRAVRRATEMGVDFLTIQGSRRTVQAAVAGKGEGPVKILFVPLLSSWDAQILQEWGLVGPNPRYTPRFSQIDDYVMWHAHEAVAHGADGLIASGPYVRQFRDRFPGHLIVAPAIRPAGHDSHEHARSLTPAQAIRNGADYLVVGRPIRDADDRRAAARRIVHEIDEALRSRPNT
ncbi:MAG: orotidine-5'-phosphate decarboxylase [Nitrospirae bacterium]|nr:MAG: orotidine-5'-phosphate decarboxylase [Nitrospirota bacterium]